MAESNISRRTYNAAIELTKALLEDYPHTGQEKVAEMLRVIDPKLPGMIMMASLRGTYEEVVVVRDLNVKNHRKINAIKGVRAATGMGLKEAKDFVDSVDNLALDNAGEGLPLGKLSDEQYKLLVTELEDTGYFVL